MFPQHDPQNLIEVRDLVKYFPVQRGLLPRLVGWVQAVDQVSFNILRGETLGLVGESGCGKTTLARTMLRLIEPTSGAVFYDGANVFEQSGNELRAMRRKMQIILQDAPAALNPRIPIGELLAEGLHLHKIGKASEREEMVINMLRKVGLEDHHARCYPHQLSSGQQQRVGIARALVLRPEFIIADEPACASNPSIQVQVFNTLKRFQHTLGLTYLFIARHPSALEHVANRLGVMYLGKLVELASRGELFGSPMHPYTQALMSDLPGAAGERPRITLPGEVPSPLHPPGGCRFHTRCPVAMDICSMEEPAFRELSPAHWVACWRV